ncbi:hypothetical protein MGALJ_60950 (plasmid) [Mycobacterium gallinarum]|uniref:Uncharacterized protein n=1 Tax=Mycobacterium gallinarum TaxID=39689 RepID=A0A9W4B9A5_9MYCO|nr:hypothetical protein [Mycobacterium gallinarum]BBY96426.1 hypothetical protein MGALJ_60950 [Mycobacterium gallinarum]
MAKKRRRTRTVTGVRYWHAGWSGRRVGDLLLPVARQQGVYADVLRMSVVESRKRTADPDLASGRIYDMNKIYVTTDRDFAHAWAVCVPDPSLVPMLQALYRVGQRAYYEVELLDADANPLLTAPEPDPDYPGGGSYQADLARVVAIHRPHMSYTVGQIHMARMAGDRV